MGWWWVCLALAGEPVVIPGTEDEIQVDRDSREAVQAGIGALQERRFADAARQFAALAEAASPQVVGDLRFLEATARYEGGELRAAERVVAIALDGSPDHAGLLALWGLILADLGRGDEALGVLDRALARAQAVKDAHLQARAWLYVGLARSDLGDMPKAKEAWTAALSAAQPTRDEVLIAEIKAQLATVEGRGGDVVGQVSDKLGRGDLTGARAAATAITGNDPRSQARRALTAALIFRAEGRLDLAGGQLLATIEAAKGGGLVREQVAARLELARVLHLAGKPSEAHQQLDAALDLVRNTSFKVQLVDIHVARGRMAVLDDALDTARAELQAARAAAVGLADPLMSVRLAELSGTVASASGDPAGAEAALREAMLGWAGRGQVVEAARVACEGVRTAAAAGRPVEGWKADATRYFADARDPVGPAHVAMAHGLGLARGDQPEAALVAFGEALRLARAAGGAVGERIAGVAESNAGEVFKRIKPPEAALAKARELGLEGVVARHGAYMEARAAYEQATRDFQAAHHAAAREGFQRALDGFQQAGEAEMAATARRALAWARWNEATGAAPAVALATFEALVPEAKVIGDRELEVRSLGAGAIAAGRLKLTDAPARLRAAARQAEDAGYADLAGRCWAELAAQDLPVEEKVAAARAAFAVRRDQVGATALYRASVAAYNAEDYRLAAALADEALPYAGENTEVVRDLLAKARAAGG